MIKKFLCLFSVLTLWVLYGCGSNSGLEGQWATNDKHKSKYPDVMILKDDGTCVLDGFSECTRYINDGNFSYSLGSVFGTTSETFEYSKDGKSTIYLDNIKYNKVR